MTNILFVTTASYNYVLYTRLSTLISKLIEINMYVIVKDGTIM